MNSAAGAEREGTARKGPGKSWRREHRRGDCRFDSAIRIFATCARRRGKHGLALLETTSTNTGNVNAAGPLAGYTSATQMPSAFRSRQPNRYAAATISGGRRTWAADANVSGAYKKVEELS